MRSITEPLPSNALHTAAKQQGDIKTWDLKPNLFSPLLPQFELTHSFGLQPSSVAWSLRACFRIVTVAFWQNQLSVGEKQELTNASM